MLGTIFQLSAEPGREPGDADHHGQLVFADAEKAIASPDGDHLVPGAAGVTGPGAPGAVALP